MTNLEVLYEDNHIIAVYKPKNIPSQKDSSNDLDMLTLIKNYLKEKYDKPGNVYLGLVHRLDRPVAGVMIFAKTSKAASRLSLMIQKGEIKKKYLAVVHGVLDKKEGTLENYIMKDKDNNSVVTSKEKGKLAILNYKVLEEDKKNNLSLVDIDLKTGRHHQIRCQFSHISHPLYGDQRYGLQDRVPIALQSYSLSFIHPVSHKDILLTKYEFKDEVWKKFSFVNKM